MGHGIHWESDLAVWLPQNLQVISMISVLKMNTHAHTVRERETAYEELGIGKLAQNLFFLGSQKRHRRSASAIPAALFSLIPRSCRLGFPCRACLGLEGFLGRLGNQVLVNYNLHPKGSSQRMLSSDQLQKCTRQTDRLCDGKRWFFFPRISSFL